MKTCRKTKLPVTIISAYLAGTSVKDLGLKYEVSSSIVLSHLKRAGVTIRRGRPISQKLPIEEMAAKYRGGASLKTLSQEYGASETTIWKRLKSHGVTIRRKGRPVQVTAGILVPSDPERLSSMFMMRADGHPLWRIGKRHGGVTSQAVSRSLIRYRPWWNSIGRACHDFAK